MIVSGVQQLWSNAGNAVPKLFVFSCPSVDEWQWLTITCRVGLVLQLFGWHGRYRKGVNNWKIKRFDPCRV